MKLLIYSLVLFVASCSSTKTDNVDNPRSKTVEISTPANSNTSTSTSSSSTATTTTTRSSNSSSGASNVKVKPKQTEGLSTAVFASGCFWCVEAVFESVEGVGEVVSGYAGGSTADANYNDVSAGRTDHAEAVLVYYHPDAISYETLLTVFFGSHDPTTLNRQGPDAGRQYRSTIFYQNSDELAAAKKYIADLKSNKVFDGPITTTLESLTKFHPAEEYHQDFEARNPNQPYVRAVSIPRLKKFQAKHPELLKKNAH